MAALELGGIVEELAAGTSVLSVGVSDTSFLTLGAAVVALPDGLDESLTFITFFTFFIVWCFTVEFSGLCLLSIGLMTHRASTALDCPFIRDSSVLDICFRTLVLPPDPVQFFTFGDEA